MHDAAWILIAFVVGSAAWGLRRRFLRHFGRTRRGRLGGEFIGWYGGFLALAIALIQTNGGWHTERGSTVLEAHSTWAKEGPIYLLIATVLALGSHDYLERHGRHWLGDEAIAFPSEYVADILAAEARSTPEQCRQMAKRLLKSSRRSQQALPDALAAFVNRHLDRTA